MAATELAVTRSASSQLKATVPSTGVCWPSSLSVPSSVERHCSRGGAAFARPESVSPFAPPPDVPLKCHSRAVPSLLPLASRVPLPLHATLVTSLRWPRSVATHAGAPPAALARAAAFAAAPVGVTPAAPPPASASAAASSSMAFCSAALQEAVTRKTCSTESVVPTAKRVPPGLHAAWKAMNCVASATGSCALRTGQLPAAAAGGGVPAGPP